MRIRIALAVAALTLPALTGVASAAPGGNVERHQSTTYDITFQLEAGGKTYGHDIEAADDVCGTVPSGDFAGTGEGTHENAGAPGSTVVGSLDAGQLDLEGDYTGRDYQYSIEDATVNATTGDFTGVLEDSNGQTYNVTGNVQSTTTNYANHGQFVKASGGGSEAGRSCIGMPVQSQK